MGVTNFDSLTLGENLIVGGTCAITGTSTFTGAQTFTGAATFAGGASFTGAVSGGLRTVTTLTDNYTILTADFGKVFLIATDKKTITLPAVSAANKGGVVTIVNSGADGNNIVTISPSGTNAIFGTIANAAADSVSSGGAGKDWVNTKATANKGDYCVLMSDGATGWFILGGVGIWASEA